VFYQHGKLYTYELRCELVDRMGAIDINTGNTEIDLIETNYSQDILTYQFLYENGDTLQNEDGEYVLQEYRVETQTKTANNEIYFRKSLDFIDFSERNPFSEVDRY
jgi:hypothetical protein